MLRGAIIGFGNIATRGHVPAYLHEQIRNDVKIVGIVDVVEQNRHRVAELFPGTAFYSDIESLFSSEKVDFVDICTPPYTHVDYIRSAAGKGIHIICEKPLAEKFDTTVEIANVVRKSDIAFVPCHQYKYSPLWKTIHEMIASGVLGA